MDYSTLYSIAKALQPILNSISVRAQALIKESVNRGLFRTVDDPTLQEAFFFEEDSIANSFVPDVALSELTNDDRTYLLHLAELLGQSLNNQKLDITELVPDPYLLLEYNGNWADEIDVQGHRIMRKSEWEASKAAIKKGFEQGLKFTDYVGSNEEIVYEDYDDWLDTYEETVVSELEAMVLKEHMVGNYGTKHFYLPDDFEEDVEA